MSKNNDDETNLEIIKRLLIVELILNGVSIRDIMKITDMGASSIYKFLPKDLMKKSFTTSKQSK
ncbi:MAG: helix-turn-helix domain-containing protein [Patescibacteria group bacterium]|nr:helix-turn-helix domain-containing protein [Patescibacteria group bacterium]